MHKYYEHTQIGYLTIFAISPVLLLMIYIVVTSGFNWINLFVILIFGIALLLFATLQTTINDKWLEIRFGIGIIRKRIQLNNIDSVHIIKYPWYYGWGLRFSFRGEQIYSVSGLSALKINLKTGEKYIISTDDPDKLSKAVQMSMTRYS